MDLMFKVFAWVFVSYMFWCLVTNQSKISRSNKEALDRLKSLEAGLKDDISKYKTYTTGHPYTWSEVSYEEKFSYIVNSAGWSLSFPWWHKACPFVTKVDESNKFIYIVTERESFDFSKLKHYDEWLKSNDNIAKNIENYKNS